MNLCDNGAICNGVLGVVEILSPRSRDTVCLTPLPDPGQWLVEAVRLSFRLGIGADSPICGALTQLRPAGPLVADLLGMGH